MLKTPEKLHGEKETLTPSCRGKPLPPIKHCLHSDKHKVMTFKAPQFIWRDQNFISENMH